jgi:hypothetical protein
MKRSGVVAAVCSFGVTLAAWATPGSPEEPRPVALVQLVRAFINTMPYNLSRMALAMVAGHPRYLCLESAHSPFSSLLKRRRSWRLGLEHIRHHIGTSCEPRSSSTPPPASATTRSPLALTLQDRSSASGESVSSRDDSRASRRHPESGAPSAFPPDVVVAVKALACQLPHESDRPISKWTMAEFRDEVLKRGIVASVGETTLWRWLSEDAIRPWTHRSWIFPRDPDFKAKASRVLDLYEGRWQGRPLQPGDMVLSADEKTGIQALQRCHPTVPAAPGRPALVEHEYRRKGTLAYLAAWDVRRARIHGRCEPRVGIAPFEGLVEQVMRQKPYRNAPRVFWILDNGTSHRGQKCVDRLRQRWPNLIVVHLPKHASWLNQIEIYFSVVQRKVLTPADFSSLDDLKDRLLRFQDHYQQAARPFEWRFTRRDLANLLARLEGRAMRLAA